jgi:hypothetical protein
MPDYQLPLLLDAYLALECRNQPTHSTKFRCVVSRKNVRMVSVSCEVCNAFTVTLKYRDFEKEFGLSVNDLPILHSNACQLCDAEGCAACSGRCQNCQRWRHKEDEDGCAECSSQCERCYRYIKTEIHHTAPRAMFEDSHCWPMVSLCRLCHQEWHRVMTPGMRYNPAPVAEHLRAEWDAYEDAAEWIYRGPHDYFCECRKCVDSRKAIDARHNRRNRRRYDR